MLEVSYNGFLQPECMEGTAEESVGREWMNWKPKALNKTLKNMEKRWPGEWHSYPENSLSSLCVVRNDDQNLMSIIKNVALLTFAGLLRALAYVVFSTWIQGLRNGGHSDLQRNNCVKMHFCSFSVCLCNTDISDSIGWVAADLLHPLTEIQICNLSRILFSKSVTGLWCCYKPTHEYHHHVLYMGHLQFLWNMN